MPEKVNLADVASRDVSVNRKADRRGRISFRLQDCMRLRQQLTSFQADMITSFNFWFEQNGDLTDNQFRQLLRIWHELHEDGYVRLPKGMV